MTLVPTATRIPSRDWDVVTHSLEDTVNEQMLVLVERGWFPGVARSPNWGGNTIAGREHDVEKMAEVALLVNSEIEVGARVVVISEDLVFLAEDWQFYYRRSGDRTHQPL